jgi:hypothetical protein
VSPSRYAELDSSTKLCSNASSIVLERGVLGRRGNVLEIFESVGEGGVTGVGGCQDAVWPFDVSSGVLWPSISSQMLSFERRYD